MSDDSLNEDDLVKGLRQYFVAGIIILDIKRRERGFNESRGVTRMILLTRGNCSDSNFRPVICIVCL